MTKGRKQVTQILFVGLLALLLVVAIWVWREAYNELSTLCGNFKPGVSQTSVVTQLNTGVFLHYQVPNMANESRIVASSPVHLGMFQCVIQLDQQQQVIEARFF